MKQRFKRVLTMCLLGVLVGSGVAWFQMQGDARTAAALAPAAGETATEAPMSVGGPFSLTDHNGATVTEKTYPGLKLAFFGFTHCPDICPTGLQKMSLTLKALGDDASAITPLFITVDSERDTPDILKEYVSVYDDRLTGLTGTPEEIKTVTESFRVYAAKESGADPSTYMMNHSGFTYLLDDDGKMLTVFGADEGPAEIAAEIKNFLEHS